MKQESKRLRYKHLIQPVKDHKSKTMNIKIIEAKRDHKPEISAKGVSLKRSHRMQEARERMDRIELNYHNAIDRAIFRQSTRKAKR